MKQNAKGCFHNLPTYNTKADIIGSIVSGISLLKIKKRISIPDQSNGGSPIAGIINSNMI